VGGDVRDLFLETRAPGVALGEAALIGAGAEVRRPVGRSAVADSIGFHVAGVKRSLSAALADHHPGHPGADQQERHGVVADLGAEVGEHVGGAGALQGIGQLVDELPGGHLLLQSFHGAVEIPTGGFDLHFDFFG
jgi:hypothetical protein